MPLHELRVVLERRFPTAWRTREARIHDPAAIPDGAVTEVVGPPGSGGCTLVLRRVVEVLEGGSERYAAFIDLARELYPPAAAALGVPLSRLLVIRATGLEEALQATEILLRGGATRVIVMDLPPGTPPLRLSTYHRLRRRVRESGAALVLLTRVTLVPADHRIEL